ncbi:MAG: hypothetical protein AAF141_05975 [Pseudomonadota bacterium]
MRWLTALRAVLSLLAAVAKRSRELEAAAQKEGRIIGRREALKEALEDARNLVNEAEHARRVFRDRLAANPDGLRADDGYRRD